MMITPVGLILIPLGIIFFIKGKKYLFWSVIATSPLTEVEILKLSMIAEVLPAFYFGGLLILKHTIDKAFNASQKKQYIFASEHKILIIFLFVSLASILMPFILEGTKVYTFGGESFLAIATYGYDALTQPLNFSISNITQYIYLLFVTILFFLLSRYYYNNPKRIYTTIKIFVAISLIVLSQQLINEFLYLSNNMFITKYVNYFQKGTFELYSTRGSSAYLMRGFTILGEPGHTSVFHLTCFGIAFAFIFNLKHLDKKFKKYALMYFLCMLLSLLMTLSTTAYVGLLIFFTSALFVLIIQKLQWPYTLSLKFVSLSLFTMLISTLFIIGLMYSLNINFLHLLYEKHLNKLLLEAGSGAVRYSLAINSLELLKSSPLLGLGYGSARSTSGFITILTNTGILGGFVFSCFYFILFKKSLYLYRSLIFKMLSSFMLSSSLLIITYFSLFVIAKAISMLLFIYTWVIFAMISGLYLSYTRNHFSKINKM